MFMSKQFSSSDHSDDVEMMVIGKTGVRSVMSSANRCGSVRRLDCQQKGQMQKMDGTRMRQCSVILKKLMTHPVGWVFNQPVDPVKLNIPDYFAIISEPMDLGTVKSKLEAKMYLVVQEFAADVKLTFSNAMRYNPPANDVHIMAKELNNIFNLRWKSLELKWKEENPLALERSNLKKIQKQTHNPRRNPDKTPGLCLKSPHRTSLTPADKQKLRKDLAKYSHGNMPPHLSSFLQRIGALGPNNDKLEVDIDAFDAETAQELHRIMTSSVVARSTEIADVENNSGYSSLQKDISKGNGDSNRSKYGSVNDDSHMSIAPCVNGTCNGLSCCCSCPNDFTQASSSDLDSDRSSGRETHACRAGTLNSGRLRPNDTKTSLLRTSSDPDSDGAASVLEEENIHLNSSPEGIVTSYGEQLSPSKALRAAIMRSRFADTILKAQNKTLLNHGEKGDPIKMQREREKLEKKQKEEKARIEAKVRAAEAAARMKVEAELKMQRQKQREAARLALQQMERTVNIDENREIMEDLEMLGFCQPNNHHQGYSDAATNAIHGNPLEQLGLFMKDEDMEEEEEAVWECDIEEGEIGS